MSASENLTVDKLLKKVYAVHKQSVNDVTAELTRCKENLQRSEERIKELTTENEQLSIENKRLSAMEENKQTSCGGYSDMVIQSLQRVNTSYEELIKEKVQRIKLLEDELKKYKRRFSTADSLAWTAVDESQDTEKNKQLRFVGNSPDSTSKLTPVNQASVSRVHVPNSPLPPQTVTVEKLAEIQSDRSPDESQKLKLQRRGKRSRYSEDISPELKRPRHRSGSNANGKGHKHPKKVLVQDTCHHLETNTNSDTSNTDRATKRKGNLEETVLVVPETMAVEDDDADSELDDEDIESNEFRHKLTTIEELSETAGSVLTNRKMSDLQNDKGSKGQFDKLDELTLDTDRFSLRSELESAGCDDNMCDNDSLYEAISDMGASVVDDFDRTTGASPDNQTLKRLSNETEKTTNNVTMHSPSTEMVRASSSNETSHLQNKSVIESLLDTTHRSHPLGGRCKSIQEVDALFETPESKTNIRGGLSQEERAGNKKRLFKKGVQKDIHGEAAILRRSPRKKKEFDARPEADSRRQRSKLAEDDSKGARNYLKSRNPEESDDNDLTIAPDMNNSAGNQSMDLYHVVPVKNGQPVVSKQFQMKVKKNKYDTKGSMKKKHNHLDNCTIRSPVVNTPEICSVMDMKLKGSKVSEVIMVSSPSVGSLSDPESPLLLKPNKNDKKEKGKDATVQSRSKNEALAISPSKVSRSRSSSNQTHSKRNKTNTCTTVPSSEDSSQGDSPRSKSLRQTTLTQRFFSPNKKPSKIFKSNTSDGKKALSFQDDTDGLDDDVMIADESFSFKRPAQPVKKESSSSKRKVSKQGDETVAHNDADQHPFHDISAKHLNGSLDPAAELSMLCGEPESLENQPIKSLPSLDIDFCADDLDQDQASLPKTSTLAAEESEDMPSSYRFMPKKKPKEVPNKENVHVSLDDSFDRPPKKAVDTVAHIAVVRKKDERQKLQGYGCKQCEEYYKSTGRSDEEVKSHMNQCSRHRAQYLPPDTPPHFWSVGFIDTQECVDRGYIKIDENRDKKGDDGNTHRRRRRLNKYFKSKTEGSANDSDEDLVYE